MCGRRLLDDGRETAAQLFWCGVKLNPLITAPRALFGHGEGGRLGGDFDEIGVPDGDDLRSNPEQLNSLHLSRRVWRDLRKFLKH